jgi:hypothetical protein
MRCSLYPQSENVRFVGPRRPRFRYSGWRLAVEIRCAFMHAQDGTWHRLRVRVTLGSVLRVSLSFSIRIRRETLGIRLSLCGLDVRKMMRVRTYGIFSFSPGMFIDQSQRARISKRNSMRLCVWVGTTFDPALRLRCLPMPLPVPVSSSCPC